MNDSPVGPVGDPEPAAEKKPPVAFMTGGGAAPPKGDTSYVLLELEGSGYWTVVNTGAEARSAEAAIRARVEANTPSGPVTLVAVPTRSWRPVTVTPKVTTSLVIEEAS